MQNLDVKMEIFEAMASNGIVSWSNVKFELGDLYGDFLIFLAKNAARMDVYRTKHGCALPAIEAFLKDDDE